MKRISAFVPFGIAASLFLATDIANKSHLHNKDDILNARTNTNAKKIRELSSQNEQLFDRINQRLDRIESQVFEIREIIREMNILIDRELENEDDLEIENCGRYVDSVIINHEVQDDSSIEDSLEENEIDDNSEAGEESFDENEIPVDQDAYETEFIETPHK